MEASCAPFSRYTSLVPAAFATTSEKTNKKCKIEFPLCLSESEVSEWSVSVDGRERLKKGSPGFARLAVPRPEPPPAV